MSKINDDIKKLESDVKADVKADVNVIITDAKNSVKTDIANEETKTKGFYETHKVLVIAGIAVVVIILALIIF